METIIELLAFLQKRKKYYLYPIMFILLALGGLFIFSGGSALTPFIYVLF